ncbi:MAG TPA: hypothetical protein VFS02_25565, partial [Telluria sp.]|nr:hypothetical protein [Telluria sp.]
TSSSARVSAGVGAATGAAVGGTADAAKLETAGAAGTSGWAANDDRHEPATTAAVSNFEENINLQLSFYLHSSP